MAAMVRRAMKVLVVSVGLASASASSYFGFLQYEGNIHVVDKGKFHRSAQLDKEELSATSTAPARSATEYGILLIKS